MLISVYLHKNIAETLMCYGSLSEVVDKILETSEQGIFDLMDMPKCEPRDGAIRYNIDVNNEYYLSLLNTYSVNSPRISLRRILYWFVEQEMPTILNWEVVNEYVSRDKVKMLKKIGGIQTDLIKISRIANDEENVHIVNILNELKKLREVIDNGR